MELATTLQTKALYPSSPSSTPWPLPWPLPYYAWAFSQELLLRFHLPELPFSWIGTSSKQAWDSKNVEEGYRSIDRLWGLDKHWTSALVALLPLSHSHKQVELKGKTLRTLSPQTSKFGLISIPFSYYSCYLRRIKKETWGKMHDLGIFQVHVDILK